MNFLKTPVSSNLEGLLQNSKIPDDHIITTSGGAYYASRLAIGRLGLSSVTASFGHLSPDKSHDSIGATDLAGCRDLFAITDSITQKFGAEFGEYCFKKLDEQGNIRGVTVGMVRELYAERKTIDQSFSGNVDIVSAEAPEDLKHVFNNIAEDQVGPENTLIMHTSEAPCSLRKMGYNPIATLEPSSDDLFIHRSCIVSLGRTERNLLAEEIHAGALSHLKGYVSSKLSSAQLNVKKTERAIAKLESDLPLVQQTEKKVQDAQEKLIKLCDDPILAEAQQKREELEQAKMELNELTRDKASFSKEQQARCSLLENKIRTIAEQAAELEGNARYIQDGIEETHKALQVAQRELAGRGSNHIQEQLIEQRVNLRKQEEVLTQLTREVKGYETWSPLKLRAYQSKKMFLQPYEERVITLQSSLQTLQKNSEQPEVIVEKRMEFKHANEELAIVTRELAVASRQGDEDVIRCVKLHQVENQIRKAIETKRTEMQKKEHTLSLRSGISEAELQSLKNEIAVLRTDITENLPYFLTNNTTKLLYQATRGADFNRTSLIVNGVKVDLSNSYTQRQNIENFRVAVQELIRRDPSEEELYQMLTLLSSDNQSTVYSAGTNPSIGVAFAALKEPETSTLELKVAPDKESLYFITRNEPCYLQNIMVPSRIGGHPTPYSLGHILDENGDVAQIDRQNDQNIPQFTTMTSATLELTLPEGPSLADVPRKPNIEILNSVQYYGPANILPAYRSPSPEGRFSEGSTTTGGSSDSSASASPEPTEI